MSDDRQRIPLMTESELLDYVIEDPTVLTDPYYREYGDAVRKRHKDLRDPKACVCNNTMLVDGSRTGDAVSTIDIAALRALCEAATLRRADALVNMQPEDVHAELASAVKLWQEAEADIGALADAAGTLLDLCACGARERTGAR